MNQTISNILPKIKASPMLGLFFKAVIGSAILAASSQITIPLPLVPITAQSLAVAVLALIMGPKLATATVAMYLLEGALGLPVFANASFGIPTLLGPTGGYLVGFLPMAFIIGYMTQKAKNKSWLNTFIATLLGTAVLFAFGLAQLSFFVPSNQLLEVGLYPFIIGGIIKGVIATVVAPLIMKVLAK